MLSDQGFENGLDYMNNPIENLHRTLNRLYEIGNAHLFLVKGSSIGNFFLNRKNKYLQLLIINNRNKHVS